MQRWLDPWWESEKFPVCVSDHCQPSIMRSLGNDNSGLEDKLRLRDSTCRLRVGPKLSAWPFTLICGHVNVNLSLSAGPGLQSDRAPGIIITGKHHANNTSETSLSTLIGSGVNQPGLLIDDNQYWSWKLPNLDKMILNFPYGYMKLVSLQINGLLHQGRNAG